MPLNDISFHLVAVDFKGAIQPATNRDNCYILTLEDFLLGIKKLSFSIQRECQKHLLYLFCWIGVPEQMMTDQGTQSRSKLMAETRKTSYSVSRSSRTHYRESVRSTNYIFFVELGFQNKCCRFKVLNLDQNWWQKQVDVNFSCWRLRCVTISSNDSIEHLNRYYMYAVYVLKDRLALEQVSISSFICKQ